MKKIVVTGGAGFLGSNLCKELVKDPENIVYCLDNFYTGRARNLFSILNQSNFKLIPGDIRTFKFDSLGNIDEIYNAACPASPPAYQNDPIGTTETCVLGILNILNYCILYPACKVLQFSTSEVYGDPITHPQKETDWGNVNPIGIRSCYDEGKRCAESLCFDYLREYNIDVRIVRIFNTYGPGMRPDDGRVISNFIVQAIKKQPITIYGNGSQTRSFCFVDDLIRGLIAIMNLNNNPNTPINLGNPGEFSLLELARTLKKSFPDLTIDYKQLPKDDPKRRRPDITLANKLLSWQPKINLEQGLNNTIKYFKEEVTNETED